MLSTQLLQNKKTYLLYNNFRKKIFSQLTRKESESILYLLPWLMSINHPSAPGYVKDLDKSFKLYGIDNEKDILKRETTFKNMFKIKKEGTLLRDIFGVYDITTIEFENFLKPEKRRKFSSSLALKTAGMKTV